MPWRWFFSLSYQFQGLIENNNRLKTIKTSIFRWRDCTRWYLYVFFLFVVIFFPSIDYNLPNEFTDLSSSDIWNWIDFRNLAHLWNDYLQVEKKTTTDKQSNEHILMYSIVHKLIQNVTIAIIFKWIWMTWYISKYSIHCFNQPIHFILIYNNLWIIIMFIGTAFIDAIKWF